MADLLCATYTVVLDELARDVHAHTVGLTVAAAMGRPVDLPDWDQVRASFDEALAAPPDADSRQVTTPKAIKMRALGLAQEGKGRGAG